MKSDVNPTLCFKEYSKRSGADVQVHVEGSKRDNESCKVYVSKGK